MVPRARFVSVGILSAFDLFSVLFQRPIPTKILSPNRPNDFRVADVLVRCYQGETPDERRRGDNTVGGVLGEGCGQRHCPRAYAAAYRQNYKMGLDFLQVGLQARIQLDAAPARGQSDLEKRDIRDRHSLRLLTRAFDGRSRLPREFSRSEGEP